MIYREYGKTGKKISLMGFGGMRLNPKDSIEKSAALLVKANELGINYFDTAPTYLANKGEVILGEAFKAMPKNYYISTKSMIQMDKDTDAVRRRIDQSLEKLGVEKITFFHMWCILSLDHYKRVMAKGGPFEGAMKAKEEGLVEHLCISTHCDSNDMVTIIEDGCYEGITIGYNLVNFPYRLEGIQAAAAQNMGIAVMNPLGGGYIAKYADYFSAIKQNTNHSIIKTAFQFIASHKEITTILSGINTEEELSENAAYFTDDLSIKQSALEKWRETMGLKLDALCTGCNYCKDCPKEIPIAKLLDAYNRYIFSKSKMEIPLMLHGYWGISAKKAAECIACGLCEKRCTQKLPIIERLNFISGKKK